MEISEHFDNNEIDKEILIENFQVSTLIIIGNSDYPSFMRPYVLIDKF